MRHATLRSRVDEVLALLRALILGDANTVNDGDEQTIVRRAVDLALTPVRIATSRTAIKAYLSVLLFLTISTILISVSSTAYLFFYYNYIPQISLEKIIHLQYVAGTYPHATIGLEASGLISQQPYDIDLVLHMPRTPANLAAGNFMLDLALLSDTSSSSLPVNYLLPNITFLASQTPLHRSRRPAILPYNSLITSLSHTLLHLPSHLLRLHDLDSSVLQIPMFERLSFARGRNNVPTYAYVQIQSQIPPAIAQNCPPAAAVAAPGLHLLPPQPLSPAGSLQIYEAKLRFRARFRGLRYIIYNYRVLSFLVFSTLFYLFSISSMTIIWALLTSFTSSGEVAMNERGVPIKQEGSSSAASGPPRVKNEPGTGLERSESHQSQTKTEGGGITPNSSDEEQAGNRTDSSTTFPVLGRNAPPLRYTGSGRQSADLREQEEEAAPREDDHTHDAEDEEDEDPAESIARYGAHEPADVDIKEESDQERSGFGDSGIGTSMESEHTGMRLVRRRSGRERHAG